MEAQMAEEVRARVTRENYPSIRATCGGGMEERYEDWLAGTYRFDSHTRDLNPQPPIWVDVDLEELRAFCKRTGQRGETALHNYAFEKSAAMK
jgi:hypothetical protein